MENVAFPIPHLRKIIFKIYTQKTQEIQKHEQKSENLWYLGHTDFEQNRIC